MVRLVVKTLIGLPVVIIGIVLLLASGSSEAWIVGWPLLLIAILVFILGIGVLWKAWSMFRGGL